MKKKAKPEGGARNEPELGDQLDHPQLVECFLRVANSMRKASDLIQGGPNSPSLEEDDVEEYLKFLERVSSEPPFVTKGKVTEWRAPCDDYEPTIEYALPIEAEEIRNEHREKLTPWFSRFLGSEPQAVRALLVEEWSTVDLPIFRKFTSYLGTLTPRSFVFADNRKWLLFWNSQREDQWIMIPEPTNITVGEMDFLSQFGIADLPHFCRHFQGSFDAPYPYHNGFTIYPFPASENALGKLGHWQGGMNLYSIGTGDAIILGKNGKIGRWFHEIGWNDAPCENRGVAVKKCADSFAEFIDIYLSYSASGANEQLFR